MCIMRFKEIAHLKLSSHLLSVMKAESLGEVKYFRSFTAKHIDKDLSWH